MSSEKKRYTRQKISKVPPAPCGERHSQPPANAGNGLAGKATLPSLTEVQEGKRKELEKMLVPALGRKDAEKVSLGIIGKREDVADMLLRSSQDAPEIVQAHARAFSGNGFNVGEVINKLYAHKYGTGKAGDGEQEERIMNAMEVLDGTTPKPMKGMELAGILRDAGFEVVEAERQYRVYWNGKPVRSNNRHVMFPSKQGIGPKFVSQVRDRCREALDMAIDEL
jgi:hypothetical protein